MSEASQIVSISNKTAAVSVNLSGGAIVDFHFVGSLVHSFIGSLVDGGEDGVGEDLIKGINPLTFKREGVNFQGHFLCLGRWGPPSAGEAAAGIVTHGEAVTQTWAHHPSAQKNELLMSAMTPLEGLRIERTMVMDKENAVFMVKESIKNINPLGRMFNVVQHPTIGRPFLSNDTIVTCNAYRGFNYKLSKVPVEHESYWPFGTMEDGGVMNVSKPNEHYSSVFSYTIKKDAEFGWIAAFSPKHNSIIGYLWRRKDYPWINLWQDFDEKGILYRGLEFGTTGMHKPYKEIIEEGNHRVFDEDSYKYIDAGETQSRRYLAFLVDTPVDFHDVANVALIGNEIIINEGINGGKITIPLKLDTNGL